MTHDAARKAALACCLLFAASVCTSATAQAASNDTMTLEDVVQLFVQGTSADELIRRIETSQVDFDLQEDMLDELRLAGLPEKLIEAMQRRQLELHPPPQPADDVDGDTETTPTNALTVRLDLHGATKIRDGEDDRGLRLFDVVPQDTLKILGVRDPAARISDIAIYVACLSATHVPDHWRGQSPLGRDFNSVTRHKMLAFHGGAVAQNPGEAKQSVLARMLGGAAVPDVDGWSVLNLAVPEQLTAPLDAAEGHDLSVGVAIRLDGRYYRIVSDEIEGFVPAERSEPLEVTIELPNDLDPFAIAVRIDR